MRKLALFVPSRREVGAPAPIMAAATVALSLLAALLTTTTLASPISAQAAVHRITLPIAADRLDDVRWTDTWGAARSGGRSHIGVDVLGLKMIPVVAAADGAITWGRFNNSRGSILRFRADDGWEYQYIHLNNDTPGTDDGRAACTQVFSEKLCNALEPDGELIKGTRIAAGEVIGYLGDSGNAEWTSPHLHFETYQPTSWGVTPVNPYPIFTAAAEAARNGTGPATKTPKAFPPMPRDLSVQEKLATATQRVAANPPSGQLDRLYLAFFLRHPDPGGLEYWVSRYNSGFSLTQIAEWFAQSDEFTHRYGALTFSQFLDQLYIDVLGRAPDQEGKSYWLDRLASGLATKGDIVVYFSEGDELVALSSTRTELTILSQLFQRGVPTPAQYNRWAELRATTGLEQAISVWFLEESPES